MAVAHIATTTPDGGTNGGTSGSANSTGANFAAIGLSWYTGATQPTVSDFYGNSYTGRTQHDSGGTLVSSRIFDCLSPTVGGSHTVTCSGTFTYSSIGGSFFSGVATSSAFDQQNGAGSTSAASINTGSVTPSEDNELLFTHLNAELMNPPTIGSSFTLAAHCTTISGRQGNGLAYKIQTTAGAENPLWSGSGTSYLVASIATYKAAAGAGTTRGMPFGTRGTAFNGGRGLQGIIR